MGRREVYPKRHKRCSVFTGKRERGVEEGGGRLGEEEGGSLFDLRSKGLIWSLVS